jgi:hypothetical protein
MSKMPGCSMQIIHAPKWTEGAANNVVHVVSRLRAGNDIEMADLDSSEIVRQRLYVGDDDPKRVALSAWESVVYGLVYGLTWRSMVP